MVGSLTDVNSGFNLQSTEGHKSQVAAETSQRNLVAVRVLGTVDTVVRLHHGLPEIGADVIEAAQGTGGVVIATGAVHATGAGGRDGADRETGAGASEVDHGGKEVGNEAVHGLRVMKRKKSRAAPAENIAVHRQTTGVRKARAKAALARGTGLKK